MVKAKVMIDEPGQLCLMILGFVFSNGGEQRTGKCRGREAPQRHGTQGQGKLFSGKAKTMPSSTQT